jgi:hypothetical protein
MKLEELQKLSKEELMNCRVMVIPDCKRCTSYDHTFIPGCKTNNGLILEKDKNGFSTDCHLVKLEELITLHRRKTWKCTCEECLGGYTD